MASSGGVRLLDSPETMGRTEIETAFREAAAGAAAGAEIGDELARCVAVAREKWPRAQVEDVVFARRLGCAAGDAGVAGLDGVEADDLYLVCGCLQGDSASVLYLSDLVGRGAPKWASGIDIDTDDLAQRVLARLLVVESPDEEPRLAGYAGRAPLVAYLKRVTRNLAISLIRSAGQNDATPPPSTFFRTVGNPEDDAIRLQFGQAFANALDEAFRALESRERAVIAMHYADGVEVDAIAKVYRVHRVTVSRWLADARASVFEATRQRLRATLGLTESDFENALRIIRSQIEISLSTLASRAARAEAGTDDSAANRAAPTKEPTG